MSKHYKFDGNGNAFQFDWDTPELCCAMCKHTYDKYNDPFTIVFDTNSFVEVTYELCMNCIRSFQHCNECNRVLNEPWEHIYFNINDNTYYCQCCYNDKRNKHYKKCYKFNCSHCCEKHNIQQPNVVKFTSNAPLENIPKRRKL